jgi:hypothetical protein
MRLGRYGDAVEAFRYGREIDPRTPALYDLLAGAYAAQGEAQRVAATLLGKVLLLGPTPESLGQIAKVFGAGSCAIDQGAGWMKLNEACPRIQADLCAADWDLTGMLRNARLPETAGQFAARAAKIGCMEEK